MSGGVDAGERWGVLPAGEGAPSLGGGCAVRVARGCWPVRAVGVLCGLRAAAQRPGQHRSSRLAAGLDTGSGCARLRSAPASTAPRAAPSTRWKGFQIASALSRPSIKLE